MASYRLRVAVPAPHLGCEYTLGATGDPTFFFKNGDPQLARSLNSGVVYDVVNNHFTGKHAPDYHAMAQIADVVTCASPVMAEIVKLCTGKDAVVIEDPYENEESPARVMGDSIVWFGHQANYQSLQEYKDLDPWVLTGDDWSLENEQRALHVAAVVLLTGNNPGASSNRPVKAIRAGRFVVAPMDCPESWKELCKFMWIGDVRTGIDWALNNRDEACRQIQAGQKYTQERFSPTSIGARWMEVFASI